MLSDQQIAESLDSLLRETPPGPAFSSLNDVLHLLQSRLGFDLSAKIDLIRSRVAAFYSPRYPLPLPPSAPAAFHQNPVFSAAAPSRLHPQYQLHFSQPHGPVFHNASEISFSQPHPKPHASNAAAPDAPRTKEGTLSKPKRKGGAGGLNKLCGVSPELQTIVGQPSMARTEIVKQLWVYIRKNNLQDPSNKRIIICNDELRLLFETDSTDMFQMNKLLAKHISPLGPSKDTGPKTKKAKVDEEPAANDTESNPVVLSEEPAGNDTEFNSVVLSEALACFFGENKSEMPQSEVVKRFSAYVKAKGLEDTSNSVIVCDAKLQELLGCESLPVTGIYDTLLRHHLLVQKL